MTEDIKTVTQKLDNAFEDEKGLTPEMFNTIADCIPNEETFGELLPQLKNLATYFKNNAEEADKKAKMFSESKKMWKGRTEQLLAFVGFMLGNRLNKESLTANNIKAKITTRTVLDVDSQPIIDMFTKYETLTNALSQLPDFIKVSFTIDKDLLSSHLKQDPQLMVNYPELVHTRPSHSVNLK